MSDAAFGLPAAPCVLRRAHFLTTPWKNGGGITHEIARAGAGPDFLWRLSVAEVAQDGPFSPFPGLSRILTVIAGAGMRLVRPDGSHIAAPPDQPVAFSGDERLTGALIDGPCRDFNLIFDAARVSGAVRMAGPTDAVPGAVGALCLAGELGVLTADGGTVTAAAGDFIFAGGAALGMSSDARALVVWLSRAGGNGAASLPQTA